MENVPIFKKATENKNQKDLPSTTMNNSQCEKQNSLSLDDLKKIPAKKRTPEENKEIRRLMAKKRKEQMSEESLEKLREKEREKKKTI